MLTAKNYAVLLGATVIGLVIGAALGYGPLLRYKSEGVMSMEMGSVEYKNFTELANDSSTIDNYIASFSSNQLPPEAKERLIEAVNSGKWHVPLPKVSKADTKLLPDVLIQLEQEREKLMQSMRDQNLLLTGERRLPATVYLGLKLSAFSRGPSEATEMTSLLGSYAKDVAVREAIREQVATWAVDSRQFSDRASEQKLKFNFDIEQAQTRATALKVVVATYPELNKRDAQQVVDVRADNEKFLSPLSQLVAAESQIITTRERLKKLNREIEQQTFIKALVMQAESIVSVAKTGSEVVQKMSAVISEYSKKANTDGEREKLLGLAADISQISARFLTQSQFVARPSAPIHPERPRPLMIMLVGGVFALLAAALFIGRVKFINLLREDRSS